jgi:sporadic carbohydrate cluster 2OG-Fe(II) oxygenase
MSEPIINPALPLVVSSEGCGSHEIVSFVSELLRSIVGVTDLDLSKLHEVVGVDQINTVRTRLFELVNEEGVLDQLYARKYGHLLRTLLGPDVLIQRRYNVSIQLPGDVTSILPAHSDCWSGDSPYQINLFFAVTSCLEGNAMFLCPFDKSTSLVKRYQEGSIDFNEMLIEARLHAQWRTLNPGDLLVFNPAAFHGNEINTTTSTRISLNVRLKGKHAPELSAAIVDRVGEVYYREFFRSEIDREAENYVRALISANCL